MASEVISIQNGVVLINVQDDVILALRNSGCVTLMVHALLNGVCVLIRILCSNVTYITSRKFRASNYNKNGQF